MTYLHILMAIQNQNIEEFRHVMDEDVILTVVNPDNTDYTGGYNDVIARIEKAFEIENDWDFDLTNRIERKDSELLFINVFSKEKNGTRSYNAVWILTCTKGKESGFLKRVHIEVISDTR
ncbi:hypothetical protein [Macrococcus lamae]|uniref:Nuclear transport factor 2 family protein n=1 Tax=Macrococcus lamae TaxID=198484 RepID=A0A4R6BTU9_9STAP|nr:hypothetical protein [Macrococcus lamae]TDM07709.1 hypothetical protein ERX29_08175 [Macrococcus lamae]